jgi:5-methylcytosine-specific restriction endonuclease McrA
MLEKVNLFACPQVDLQCGRGCFLARGEKWEPQADGVFTKKMLHALRSEQGGYAEYTYALLKQLAETKGIVFGKGFTKKLVGQTIKAWQLDLLIEAHFRVRSGSRHREVLAELERRVSTWSTYQDIKHSGSDFYRSREWRDLRMEALMVYGHQCMLCGRNPRDHGVVLHVDHIRPISRAPHLALYFSNLQILCEDCNIGKSNKYAVDNRPTHRRCRDAI